ncbi:unnamed protein product [Paramecium sonneborni]|uniref:Uncharacterized protein n=1 Tax=Paramecium sonneborni TaxID=65129 RepID=A0A8S1KNY9_9CILI|nr:unnamed protein product [Paramecium sonneborni]
MNQELEMIQKKREMFRVQIRRKQNEHIFQQKRQFLKETSNSQDWQTPLDQIFQQAIQSNIITTHQQTLQLLFSNLTNMLKNDYSIKSDLKSFLSFMFFNLQYLQLNESQNWITIDLLDIIIICLQDIQQTFQDSEENENILNFDQKLIELLNNILIFIASLSSQINMSQQSVQIQQIVLFIINILHYLHDLNQFEIVCKLIINIILERSEQYITLIQESVFPQIILHKYEDLSLQQNYRVLYQIYLYFGQITGICPLKYGTQLFQETFELQTVIKCQPTNIDQNYYSCVEQYFYFLQNITQNIEENKPRTYQLFNILIDQEIVAKVANYLLQLRYEFQIIHGYGYQFLINLSMIQSSYSMEKLISQNVFKLVLFQINDQINLQYLIYPLLSNLLTTNKQQTKQMIFDSGILGKVYVGFQTALNGNSQHGCLEIIQCIVNMFQNITLLQQQQLIQKGMLECLLEYIIQLELDQLDMKTVEEIYGTLNEQNQINPQLKFNEQFKNKSKMIYENLDDDCDIVFFINNIINITD